MLKRLELIGFKSFAEKSRFDFAPGITAIVGPNGSGKSNIVDAVKWILGEQSAKSLRGGEMADVIFNGSSTRKSLGMAEVTMTFDNSRRHLPVDGDEVQITRRVYRDGQGEYLINGTLSRLRDIKELFLGTGAGHGAYSIIEQGRVDALLTASTKDRRQIFEEAAGISRFKARKQEALRKLEATEQNLNRVKDILLELEKTLRTLNSQATKARKFEEYQSRLKQLRVGLGLREYREIADTLSYQNNVLERLRSELGDANERIESGEAALSELDAALARVDDAVRQTEKAAGEARQRIAEQDAAAANQRDRSEQLESELVSCGRQRLEVQQRLEALAEEIAAARTASAQAADAAAAEQHRADAAAAALSVVTATIAELTRQVQAARESQFAVVARAAQLTSAVEMTGAQVERLRRELARKRSERDKTTAESEAIRRVADDLARDSTDLQSRLAAARTSLEGEQSRQAEFRRQADELQPTLDGLRDRRGDMRGRVDVLEQLERDSEGVGTGVQAALDRLRDRDDVAGMVADLISVPRDIAPLIDLALGEQARHIVIRDPDALESILAMCGELPGRVGFIPLGSQSGLPITSNADYDVLGVNVESAAAQPALADSGRARIESETTSPIPGLVERLLGNVRIVETLAEAVRLQPASPPGSRFVTRRGELLEADGTVVIGPAGGGLGIVSRKSELRELRRELATLDDEAGRLEAEQGALRRQAEGLEAPIAGLQAEIAALTAQTGDVRDALATNREKQARLADFLAVLEHEATILENEHAVAAESLATSMEQAAAADRESQTLKAELDRAESQLQVVEATREARQEENTRAQVAFSEARQQATLATGRVAAIESEIVQRRGEDEQLIATGEAAARKLEESRAAAAQAAESAAEARLLKDRFEAEIAAHTAERERLRGERDRANDELRSLRDRWKQHQDQAHAHELTVRDLANRRDSIVERIREDYSLDLAELSEPEHLLPEGLSEDDVQGEIDELRRKINRLGSVNLEALEQLAQEEAREKQLRGEFDDLTAAEKSLLEIIETINADSRRLFIETLATIRLHFQELFRKLFGGGMADVVLDDPSDVLESGIEITARPPGKELRSISLLSGGEKTLTAVALLLAIFRSKPSPFCLLDEVDAALDEANTARLAAVLREFLDQSQFIIITHKKRTMAMADVLYGITMQESGVSKQVATRIEDWPDDEQHEHAA